MPPDLPKYRRWVCACGGVVDGVLTFKDYWIDQMIHILNDCPNITREHANRIRAMVRRDNEGEFEAGP